MPYFSDIKKRSRLQSLSPSALLVAGFALTILAGMALLMLPGMCSEERIGFVDALFTATSAVCVTGLVVVDTGTYFTRAGQWLILALIQIGGLGIFTFSTVFVILLMGKPTLKRHLLIQEAVTQFPYRNLLVLLRNILLFTFGAEAIGALCLWLAFKERLGDETAVYFSIFHSISAFCNAGFSLWPNSLEGYSGNMAVCLTIMILIILGGLGFTVIAEMAERMAGKRSKTKKLSLHSRVVLVSTALLILFGALLFGSLERNNVLASMPFPEQVLVSLFQSVTARTAGFNTVPLSGLASASLFTLVILMFIGASPGSVGGGVKTTTFAVYAAMIVSYLRGKENVEMFGRTIPVQITSKAMATIAVSFFLVIFSTLSIQILEGQHIHSPTHTYFLDWLFEVVSAYGTVGLATGLMPGLGDISKLVIVGTMFVGRVGPLGLALSLFGREYVQRFKYPEENVMIG